MHNLLCSLLAFLLLVPSLCHATVITQIRDPFEVTLFAGASSRQSEIDVLPPLSTLFVTYDNFTFSDSGNLTEVRWVGTYETGPLNPEFTISIFNDVAAMPSAAPLFTTVVSGSETFLANKGGRDYFRILLAFRPWR